MKTTIISNTHVPGAIVSAEDAFASIGHGLEVALPKGVKAGDSWELTISPLTTDQPLAHTHLGGVPFVSNDQELLSLISGNLLQCGLQDNSTYDHLETSRSLINHRSTKLATYFNHIFIAKGNTLWWTDLDSYWNWYPETFNEADFRQFDWEHSEISALCVLNEILYVHFPHTIYECTYSGKPAIVRILNRVTGSGAIGPRCLCTTKNAIFFLGTENFYLWSPDIGLKEIGQEVWKRFLASSTDLTDTWCYLDKRNQEVCWVNNDIVWAFNHIEGHWSKFSAEGILDHTTAPWHRDFAPISSETTGSNIEPDRWGGIENLWVGCMGLVREGRLTDSVDKLLPMETPFLETDDFTYGDLHSYKTTDLVVLDAEVKKPWVGIKVLVKGKRRVTQESEWVDGGLWTDLKEHQDFVAVAGKALRFRFELVSGLLCADGGMTLNGGQQLTGIKVENYDGSVKLDGSKTLREASFYEQVDNGERWFAEFYAWGERVNLPERLVGPDK